ncbi:MAG: aminotransferase class IV [Acidobacteria bacterium]|jgi:branched-chain amino acid aminotransferase|nr:aminotransferase class IV [Acidobacteriota bacterium]
MPAQRVLTLEMTGHGTTLVGEDDSLPAASMRLPAGVFSTLRTYGGRGVVRFDAHLRRLEESAARLGRPAAVDPAGARRLVGGALRAGGHAESRLRLTFAPPRLFASVEAFVPLPPSAYREGVACVTLYLHRDQPRVKDTRFIPTARGAYAQLPPGVEEGLLLAADGSILEGLSSNFFGVLERHLWTEDERALPGITRALTLEVARARLDLERRPVRRQDLPRLQEAFITSTSREVLPVARIDGEPVADGRPGPRTGEIMRDLALLIRREAEPL